MCFLGSWDSPGLSLGLSWCILVCILSKTASIGEQNCAKDGLGIEIVHFMKTSIKHVFFHDF